MAFVQSAPLPLIEFDKVTGSRTIVNGQWKPLEAASSYFCRLLNGTDQVFLTNPKYTKSTDIALESGMDQFLSLNPDKAHLLVVYAANFDTTTDDVALPENLMISDSAQFFDVVSTKSSKKRQKNTIRSEETSLFAKY
jgi:hypothetical protein